MSVNSPALAQVLANQIHTVVADPASVDAAMASRLSVRAYLPKPVPREVLTDLLEVAARAPSGTNTQPWNVYVVQGAKRDELVRQCCEVHDAMRTDPALAQRYQHSYDYYPEKWVSPFIDRRRENGWSLYGLLGIGKGDKDAMHEQHQRNFRFFDAPVGLFFTISTALGRGSLLDYGMFLQNIMLAARARGLHTCPQAAWINFTSIINPLLGIGEGEMLVCGMSLGYADEDDKVNTLLTPRVPVAEFTRWVE